MFKLNRYVVLQSFKMFLCHNTHEVILIKQNM